MIRLVHVLFFFSGFSALIYQVVWVRMFGNVFGNTVYSAALVVAVFMLGIGAGSYVIGRWADRRYAELGLDRGNASVARGSQPLLRAFGYVELAIASMGLGVALLLPHLGRLSALASSYTQDATGWYVLTAGSYLFRAGTAVVLLTPITLLMGGTLTLLIRHLVRKDLHLGGWRIASLYGLNTAGAALGCFLTDFALVPVAGLLGAQLVAVCGNALIGTGALILASRPEPAWEDAGRARSPRARAAAALPAPAGSADPGGRRSVSPAVAYTSVALALIGFAAMGMEILWFRHFTILLGGFRSVFSLLLTIILIGIGVGSLVGGLLHRRTGRPAECLMVVQVLFVAFTLLGLGMADARSIEAALMADPVYQAVAAGATVDAAPGWARVLADVWFNARPILLQVGVPALLMGFSFPLANAIIQRTELLVGRRAGTLYLCHTAGNVGGSLAAGFVLLPAVGMQASAAVLAAAAVLAIWPLYLTTRPAAREREPAAAPAPRAATETLAGSLLAGSAALGLWLLLPADHVLSRQLAGSTEGQQVLSLSEGLTEVIAVTEVEGEGRRLLTNAHAMSSTVPFAQRYMRAMAHIPLLSMDAPETVLIIGFGVGNTAHAAALHPSIRRVEVADLSRDILEHAGYFRDGNQDVLDDPRLVVYVNDGRHHLRMQPASSYDLITLEPPPPGHAGMAALYSKEFYALARTRLRPQGSISQWLPAYQLPEAGTLAMVRAFIDVFPEAVLISGAGAELLLLGTTGSRMEIDPERAARALVVAPAVHADLQRLDLGSVREIVGTFVGSARTLADATAGAAPVTDDRPLQEYGVGSLLSLGQRIPASLVDVSQVSAWCPACFAGEVPVPGLDGLDTYLALLGRAYLAPPAEVARTRRLASEQGRVIAGSAYLGSIVPPSADVHNLIGLALAEEGRLDEAIAEFREGLRLDPGSIEMRWNLAAALAAAGARQEAISHLQEVVQLDPDNGEARYDLANLLLETGETGRAAEEFRAALRLLPGFVEAHNNLGIALASLGRLDEAIEQFERAVALRPEFADAQRNLQIARQQRGQISGGGSP